MTSDRGQFQLVAWVPSCLQVRAWPGSGDEQAEHRGCELGRFKRGGQQDLVF